MNTEKILVTRTTMPPYEEYIEAIRPLSAIGLQTWESITESWKKH